jgi:hypothetical protein
MARRGKRAAKAQRGGTKSTLTSWQTMAKEVDGRKEWVQAEVRRTGTTKAKERSEAADSKVER